jgi:hypothetical protein
LPTPRQQLSGDAPSDRPALARSEIWRPFGACDRSAFRNIPVYKFLLLEAVSP